MIAMLKTHLWKEWRELRVLLLMSCALLLVMPLGLAWAVPEHHIARHRGSRSRFCRAIPSAAKTSSRSTIIEV